AAQYLRFEHRRTVDLLGHRLGLGRRMGHLRPGRQRNAVPAKELLRFVLVEPHTCTLIADRVSRTGARGRRTPKKGAATTASLARSTQGRAPEQCGAIRQLLSVGIELVGAA